MATWSGPSHRDDSVYQVEFCSGCGSPVGAKDRTFGTAQGLRGGWYCPECAEFAVALSYLDLGGTGSAPAIELVPEPHSGVDVYGTSWDTPGEEED